MGMEEEAESISRQQKQHRNGRRLPKFSPENSPAFAPGYPLNSHRGNVMLIKKHDKSRIVELEDGSLWRIWPGDIALTLNWLPTTDLRVSEIADEFCSHALIDQTDGSRVRVIEASKDWPVEQVRRFMKKG
jgi:hypothetical protein